jgi:16S rRNA (adenine1518-N6/adenine1519-N6)-dimethyltransferase
MILRVRRLGQHFLKHQIIIDRFIQFAELGPNDRVFEIGTGDGRLTKELVKKCSFVLSCELDEQLYKATYEMFRNVPNLTIMNTDALTIDITGFDCVISSLPYYLSSKFIDWFVAQEAPRATLILQKDFYDKITSSPGERKYGTYSVLTRYCFRLTPAMILPRDEFTPRPRVTSIMVKLDRVAKLDNAQRIIRALKLLFSFRGRTINSMNKILMKRFTQFEPITSACDLRVEELEPEKAIELARAFSLVMV